MVRRFGAGLVGRQDHRDRAGVADAERVGALGDVGLDALPGDPVRGLERCADPDHRSAHHSLSKPLKRSQSVTVASNASQLDLGAVEVVVDHLLAEGLAGDVAGGEEIARVVHVGRHVRLVGRVGVALQRLLELELGIDAVQAGGDHRRQRQIGIDVGTG